MVEQITIISVRNFSWTVSLAFLVELVDTWMIAAARDFTSVNNGWSSEHSCEAGEIFFNKTKLYFTAVPRSVMAKGFEHK
jgi:hypothetical protein